MNEALHFIKLDRCCRCGDDYWLDQGQKNPPYSEIRCACTHNPCRACIFTPEPVLQVEFGSKPYKVADPEEPMQVHLKLCCQCGTPANVTAMPIVERRMKLRRWGVRFDSPAAQCVRCGHSGCWSCPCFIRRDGYEFKCTAEGKKETGSRATAKSVSHSVRSLAEDVRSRAGGWFSKMGAKFEKSSKEALTSARLDSPFSSPVLLSPKAQSPTSSPLTRSPVSQRPLAAVLQLATTAAPARQVEMTISPVSHMGRKISLFVDDGEVSPL